MDLKKIVRLGTLVVFTATISIFIIILFQKKIHYELVQLGLFLLFTTSIFIGNYILNEFCNAASEKTKKILTFSNFFISAFGLLVFFNILSYEYFWRLAVGIGIISLASIQLQLIGWSSVKQNVLGKAMLAIVLVANLFLASVFIFDIKTQQIRPLIYTAVAISILTFAYGLYFSPSNKIQVKKAKV